MEGSQPACPGYPGFSSWFYQLRLEKQRVYMNRASPEYGKARLRASDEYINSFLQIGVKTSGIRQPQRFYFTSRFISLPAQAEESRFQPKLKNEIARPQNLGCDTRIMGLRVSSLPARVQSLSSPLAYEYFGDFV